MAVDVDTFVTDYPEFAEVADDEAAVKVVEAALRDAQRFVGRKAWGTRWQDGVFCKAAELLSLSPFGEMLRMKGTLSPYTERYKQMQRSLGVRMTLAGGGVD